MCWAKLISQTKFKLIVKVTRSRKGEGIDVMYGGEREKVMTLVWSFSLSQETQEERNLKNHTKVQLQLIFWLRISSIWNLPASVECTAGCII